MTNHVHLQIKTKDNHIWHLMSRINKNYARNFNNKYNYVGHVFQSRYNGVLIKNDEYVLEASRYIHLNPVRANMVDAPEKYKWSSYPVYIGKKKESIVQSEILLSYFRGNRKELYKRYVVIFL
jgi:putative transposase